MSLRKFFYRLIHWESWHYLAKYIPLTPAWLWYCTKAKSFWFFTPSNPTLTFGGFEGEGKKEMYDQLPPGSYPKTMFVDPATPFSRVEKEVVDNGFSYPFIVKPNVGMMGLMFRKIESPEQLCTYHKVMPGEYIVQELVEYPIEVSVFYYRFPNEKKGHITGFLRKEYLEVTGDGKSTLKELIEAYPRVQFRLDEMKAKHRDKLDNVIPGGEKYFLSYALNLSRGGKLVSLAHEKDEKLLKVFDDLSLYSGHFYYGRYDIKCASIEDLKQGKNFLILEFNGSGAEPHHIYGNGHSLVEAYKIVLEHWRVLYEISRYNYRCGIRYWTSSEGFAFLKKARKYFKLLRRLDRELVFAS